MSWIRSSNSNSNSGKRKWTTLPFPGKCEYVVFAWQQAPDKHIRLLWQHSSVWKAVQIESERERERGYDAGRVGSFLSLEISLNRIPIEDEFSWETKKESGRKREKRKKAFQVEFELHFGLNGLLYTRLRVAHELYIRVRNLFNHYLMLFALSIVRFHSSPLLLCSLLSSLISSPFTRFSSFCQDWENSSKLPLDPI